ncbi:MAG: hypothetical protein O3B08_07765 [Proteobacteria bacterium]|nr:hypothetical protein [Pseudomonadota bacterium]
MLWFVFLASLAALLLSGCMQSGSEPGIRSTVTVQKGGPGPLVSPSAGYTNDLEALHNRPLADNPQIVPALKADIRTKTPPYIYELARRTCETDQQESVIWLLTGYFRANYDAAKCTDTTARQGVVQLFALAPKVGKAVHAISAENREKYKRLWAAAFDLEATFPEDSDPRWICVYGMKAVMAALEKKEIRDWAKPKTEWGNIRAVVKARIIATLN